MAHRRQAQGQLSFCAGNSVCNHRQYAENPKEYRSQP